MKADEFCWWLRGVLDTYSWDESFCVEVKQTIEKRLASVVDEKPADMRRWIEMPRPVPGEKFEKDGPF